MSRLIKYNFINKDSRGSMTNLFDDNVKNISFISSEPNSLRSNHYHLKDWHYIYVLSGKIEYFYGNIDCDLDDLNHIGVNKYDCIFTPPNEFHVTYFPIKTDVLVFNNQSRDQKTYESDLVRRDLVNLENIKILIKKYSL